MHFITNGYKRFSKTNSTYPRQRVPLNSKNSHNFVNEEAIKIAEKKISLEVLLSNTPNTKQN